jgi:hypothetical protein
MGSAEHGINERLKVWCAEFELRTHVVGE